MWRIMPGALITVPESLNTVGSNTLVLQLIQANKIVFIQTLVDVKNSFGLCGIRNSLKYGVAPTVFHTKLPC
jgi:hypothetical protein